MRQWKLPIFGVALAVVIGLFLYTAGSLSLGKHTPAAGSVGPPEDQPDRGVVASPVGGDTNAHSAPKRATKAAARKGAVHRRPSVGVSDSSFTKPSATNPPANEESALADWMQTPLGQALLTASKHMRVGVDSPVVVAVSQSGAPIERQVGMKGQAAVTREVKIGRYMTARLSGSGFRIVAEDSAQQVVFPDRPTVWHYSVMPVRSGPLTLTAIVSQRFRGPSHEEQRDLDPSELSIAVAADRVWTMKDWLGQNETVLLGFVLPGGGLAALLGAFAALRKRQPRFVAARAPRRR